MGYHPNWHSTYGPASPTLTVLPAGELIYEYRDHVEISKNDWELIKKGITNDKRSIPHLPQTNVRADDKNNGNEKPRLLKQLRSFCKF